MNIEKNIEHISIGLSALGTIMAVATQQLAYAAMPITLSLALNLSNRQKEIAKANLRITKLEQLSLSNASSTLEEFRAIKSSSAENLRSLSDMDNRINDLDASLAYLHDSSLGFGNQITEIIDTVVSDKDIGQLIWKAVDDSTREQFNILRQMLPESYSYDLVYGRSESRQIFIEALEKSQESLFLVCPWLMDHAIDPLVKELIKSALQRGVCVNVGWGHLKDVANDRSRLSKDKLLKSNELFYNAVPWLYDLQDEYPHLVKIKILGTHEKFLVCDKKFAMLGSHNFMTSHTSSTEREVGIKTNSFEIINSLIEQFSKFETRDKQFAGNLN
jgi:PLD-like domain